MIRCHRDGEGGANIIDEDGTYFYAGAPELHDISQRIEAGAGIEGALREWIEAYKLQFGPDQEEQGAE